VIAGAADDLVYYGTSDCPGTPDVCKTLSRREFWEFTFTEAGTWSFHNTLNKTHAGTVRVQAQ